MKQLNFSSVILVKILLESVNGDFPAYWNVVNRCYRKYGIVPDLDRYGIIHNDDYELTGNKMNIFYKPGLFPRILSDHVTINGGIPPLGNLNLHKQAFYHQLATDLKDAETGPLVLDFESYKPRYQSAEQIYRDRSKDFVRERDPTLNKYDARKEAETIFNTTAKTFFESLLTIARKERPNALVGYYHYPYCNNYVIPYDTCSPKVMELNDDLRKWMFPKTTALYPSLYDKEHKHAGNLRYNFASAVMRETVRVNDLGLPILPYVNPLFKNSRVLKSREILLSIFWIIKYYGGDGVVIWASSKRFKTRRDCNDLARDVEFSLGPALQCMDSLPNHVVGNLRNSFPLPVGGGTNWDNLKNTIEILQYFCSSYFSTNI